MFREIFLVKEGNVEGLKELYLIRYMKGVRKFNIELRKYKE